MGMYGYLRRATAADVARMRADPALVAPFVFGEATEPPAQGGGPFGFLRRLLPFRAEPTADAPAPPATPVWPPAAVGEEVDLDKAWHGLHFLFTGTADGGEEPACFILSGGEDVGEDKWGDPVARLLSAEQVRDLAAFLDALTTEELTRRYDPARMVALQIYPEAIWERPEDREESLRFLLDAFEWLQEVTAAAARAGDALVVSVS